MIVLDSDHLTVLRFPSPRADRLNARLSADGRPVGTTVVNVEEAMRGWLAAIAKERQARRQVAAYRELADLFSFFAGLHIALFDEAAADQFDALRAGKSRVPTMDLMTAAVVRSRGALLLTANRRDFEQIPGLRFENWMDA